VRSLVLTDCEAVTDASVKALASCKALEELDLSGSQVTDAGLKALAGFQQLRSLSLCGWQQAY